MHVPSDISEWDLFQIWGLHGHKANDPSYTGKLRKVIETLQKRRIITTTEHEQHPFYSLSVDLFRRWWNVERPNLESELEKLLDVKNS
jgi:hypothetical protein